MLKNIRPLNTALSEYVDAIRDLRDSGGTETILDSIDECARNIQWDLEHTSKVQSTPLKELKDLANELYPAALAIINIHDELNPI